MYHENNARNIDDLKCIFCNIIFDRWYHLKKHLEEHVLTAGKNQVECDDSSYDGGRGCGYEIKAATSFNKITNDVSQQSITKCNICSHSSLLTCCHQNVNAKTSNNNFTSSQCLDLSACSSTERQSKPDNFSRTIEGNKHCLINIPIVHQNDIKGCDNVLSNLPNQYLNEDGNISLGIEERADDPETARNFSNHVEAQEDFGNLQSSSQSSKPRKEETTCGKKQTHVCLICQKTFTTKASLTAHGLLHSGERPFVCEICGKSFSRKSTLENHLRYHSGNRRFICEVCGARFFTSHSLTRHLKLHSGDREHVCSECGASYVTSTDLKRHQLSHSQPKPFSCELCPKTFYRKHDLTVHVKYHNGEMQYKCEYCDKKFVEKSNFKRHIRQHTGEKPYTCSGCGISFCQLHHIKKHQRSCLHLLNRTGNKSTTINRPPSSRRCYLQTDIENAS